MVKYKVIKKKKTRKRLFVGLVLNHSTLATVTL